LSQKIALLSIEIDQLRFPTIPDDYRSRLHRLSNRVGEIATDVHQLSHELHPSKLQTLGLAAAVQGLCRDIGEQRVLRITFFHDDLPAVIDPNVSLCLYRIAQEALHNVAKHSQAGDAEVRLVLDDATLCLQITDSGVGFDANSTSRVGLGLVSMRERVTPLQGQVTIHSAPGRGTSVCVRVPVTPPLSDADSPALKSA
jgi:signal transduction histidine kinase